MKPDEALSLAAQYAAPSGVNGTPTGSDEWDGCLDALCVLAVEVRRLRSIAIALWHPDRRHQ